MKLTVIADDSTVVVDGVDAEVSVSIPSNVHALQWDGSSGCIEYKDASDADISALPSWASDCVVAHGEVMAAREAEESAFTPEVIARGERDYKLAETDWWAMSDRTMTAEQAAYRQALRDITGQEGFPDAIVWPTKPT